MRIAAVVCVLGLCLVPSAARAAIDVTISDSLFSGVQVYADDANGLIGKNVSAQPSFDLDGASHTATDGSASAGVTYHWTNSGNQAIFAANATNLHLGAGDWTAYSLQTFDFKLTEVVNYAITGAIVGSGDAWTAASLMAYLYNKDTNQFVGYEEDNALGASFDQSIDGERQGNLYYKLRGATSGQIGPGSYTFWGLVQLQSFSGQGGEAEGFTQLTLTGPATAPEPVPEPATLAMWGLGALGCAVAAYRRRIAA